MGMTDNSRSDCISTACVSVAFTLPAAFGDINIHKSRSVYYWLNGPKVRRTSMIDPIRRKILKAGAAATVIAAAPRAFAQQTGQGGAAMSFYEKGPVRIRYQEAGSGFPLLLIAGGD
jgi:hypothetical protein